MAKTRSPSRGDGIYIYIYTDRAAAYIFGYQSGEALQDRVKKKTNFEAQIRAPHPLM